jgi:hypothetical protein
MVVFSYFCPDMISRNTFFVSYFLVSLTKFLGELQLQKMVVARFFTVDKASVYFVCNMKSVNILCVSYVIVKEGK